MIGTGVRERGQAAKSHRPGLEPGLAASRSVRLCTFITTEWTLAQLEMIWHIVRIIAKFLKVEVHTSFLSENRELAPKELQSVVKSSCNTVVTTLLY